MPGFTRYVHLREAKQSLSLPLLVPLVSSWVSLLSLWAAMLLEVPEVNKRLGLGSEIIDQKSLTFSAFSFTLFGSHKGRSPAEQARFR